MMLKRHHTHTQTNTQSLRGWMSREWPRTMPSRQGGKTGMLGGQTMQVYGRF